MLATIVTSLDATCATALNGRMPVVSWVQSLAEDTVLSPLGTDNSSPAARVEGSATTRRVKEVVAVGVAAETAADLYLSTAGKVPLSAAHSGMPTTSSLRLVLTAGFGAPAAAAAAHRISRSGKVQHCAATPVKATTSSLPLAAAVTVDAAVCAVKVAGAGARGRQRSRDHTRQLTNTLSHGSQRGGVASQQERHH